LLLVLHPVHLLLSLLLKQKELLLESLHLRCGLLLGLDQIVDFGNEGEHFLGERAENIDRTQMVNSERGHFKKRKESKVKQAKVFSFKL
jgi:hypothetical protein